MANEKIPALYKKYFVDKGDERRMLFEKVASLYKPVKGIYPGCFVQITPSFYIPDMTYIDADKRINKFFNDAALSAYIEANKTYSESAAVTGFQSDYSADLPLENGSYDIMFSFYAGFISQICKKYLKPGAIVVCNNSHGDSSLASADPDYRLIAVIQRNGSKFTISDKNLDSYFHKKDGSPVDKEKVLQRMIGEKFTKTAFAYVFRFAG
jgi:hypothetical protein